MCDFFCVTHPFRILCVTSVGTPQGTRNDWGWRQLTYYCKARLSRHRLAPVASRTAHEQSVWAVGRISCQVASTKGHVFPTKAPPAVRVDKRNAPKIKPGRGASIVRARCALAPRRLSSLARFDHEWV